MTDETTRGTKTESFFSKGTRGCTAAPIVRRKKKTSTRVRGSWKEKKWIPREELPPRGRKRPPHATLAKAMSLHATKRCPFDWLPCTDVSPSHSQRRIKGFVGVRYAMPWNIRFLRLLDIVSVAAPNRNTLLVWAYKRTCSCRCSLVIPREFPSIGRMFSVLLLRCTYQL